MRRSRRPYVDPEEEERELRFWDEHHPADFDEGPADIVVSLQRRPKKVVTFRMDQDLYDELRQAAAVHGVPYQRLMRELLRHSVRSIPKHAGSRPSARLRPAVVGRDSNPDAV